MWPQVSQSSFWRYVLISTLASMGHWFWTCVGREDIKKSEHCINTKVGEKVEQGMLLRKDEN